MKTILFLSIMAFSVGGLMAQSKAKHFDANDDGIDISGKLNVYDVYHYRTTKEFLGYPLSWEPAREQTLEQGPDGQKFVLETEDGRFFYIVLDACSLVWDLNNCRCKTTEEEQREIAKTRSRHARFFQYVRNNIPNVTLENTCIHSHEAKGSEFLFEGQYLKEEYTKYIMHKGIEKRLDGRIHFLESDCKGLEAIDGPRP